MKNLYTTLVPLSTALAALFLAGCRSGQSGSPYHPGPVAGTVLGNAAGVVAGNAIGFAGGAVVGTVDGTRQVLDTRYRMVRYWRTETTPDGRVIQVPYDILVDEFGRPANMPAPTGNPSPPPVKK